MTSATTLVVSTAGVAASIGAGDVLLIAGLVSIGLIVVGVMALRAIIHGLVGDRLPEPQTERLKFRKAMRPGSFFFILSAAETELKRAEETNGESNLWDVLSEQLDL